MGQDPGSAATAEGRDAGKREQAGGARGWDERGGGEGAAASEGRGERADLLAGIHVKDVETRLGGVGAVAHVVRQPAVHRKAVDVGLGARIAGDEGGGLVGVVDLVEPADATRRGRVAEAVEPAVGRINVEPAEIELGRIGPTLGCDQGLWVDVVDASTEMLRVPTSMPLRHPRPTKLRVEPVGDIIVPRFVGVRPLMLNGDEKSVLPLFQ